MKRIYREVWESIGELEPGAGVPLNGLINILVAQMPNTLGESA